MASDTHILLLKTDDAERVESAEYLEAAGFKVRHAPNGQRGLSLLVGYRPQIIIAQLSMPLMNGVDFGRQLLKYEISDIPVIAIHDENDPESNEEDFNDLALQSKLVLKTPLTNASLVEEITKLLESPSSQPGVGDVPSPPTDTPEEPVGEKLRVLLIDDDADLRSLLRMTLEMEYEIAEAEHGAAGLAMLERFGPDFIVCDIMMPVLDGLETVEAIRKNPEFYDVPVFFLSGEKHPDLPELTMEAGGNLFIEKPVEPTRLLELIHLFINEMGIVPGARKVSSAASAEPTLETEEPESIEQTPSPEQPQAPRPRTRTKRPPIRILTIDSNPDTLTSLREILSDAPGGRWESLWSSDAGEALANLYRLEPDVILYNPRQKMAGIYFIQNLFLREILDEYEFCFVGNDISPAEEEYNQKTFNRESIRLDQSEEEILKRIAEIILKAKGKIKTKRHTLTELEQLDAAQQSRAKSEFNQLRREQYDRIQKAFSDSPS